MRDLIKEKIKQGRDDEETNKTWSSRTIDQIADFAQNLDLPHFGSEQPGDTYYFSPLGVYLFGIVSAHGKKIPSSVSILQKEKGQKGVTMWH